MTQGRSSNGGQPVVGKCPATVLSSSVAGEGARGAARRLAWQTLPTLRDHQHCQGLLAAPAPKVLHKALNSLCLFLGPTGQVAPCGFILTRKDDKPGANLRPCCQQCEQSGFHTEKSGERTDYLCARYSQQAGLSAIGCSARAGTRPPVVGPLRRHLAHNSEQEEAPRPTPGSPDVVT